VSGELTLKVLAFWVVVQVLGNLATEGLKHPGTQRFFLEAFITYRQKTARLRFYNDFALIIFTIFTALNWIVVLVFGSILYGHPGIIPFAGMVLALAAGTLCWQVASAERSWTNGARYFWSIFDGVLIYLSAVVLGRLDKAILHVLAHVK
jgi:hypothetical protein